jgi:aryl-alcohol dehydrogenase-like predicted oxidoreductase
MHLQAYAKGQSEVVMGEAIKELGWKRSDVVLSTKVFWVSTAPLLRRTQVAP